MTPYPLALALCVCILVNVLPFTGHAQQPRTPPPSTLAQFMRAVTFPNANILFNTQTHDPAVPLPKRPSPPGGGQDFFEWGLGVYPGWQQVDFAALMLIETTPLFLVPGRTCENGRPVPVERADFRKYTDALVALGEDMYRAAQTRNAETVAGLTENLQLACQNCHRVYRSNTDDGKGRGANRCLPMPTTR